jgi:hypothetical protein
MDSALFLGPKSREKFPCQMPMAGNCRGLSPLKDGQVLHHLKARVMHPSENRVMYPSGHQVMHPHSKAMAVNHPIHCPKNNGKGLTLEREVIIPPPKNQFLDMQAVALEQKCSRKLNATHWLSGPQPFYLRVRNHLSWWEKRAPQATLDLLSQGVQETWPLPEFLQSKPQRKTFQEEAQALQVLQEYMEVGAVIKNPPGVTRHLIPWFVLAKMDNGKEKLRLISDCRMLNHYFQSNHFKMDHWNNIFPFLKKGMWAGK